MRRDPSNRPNSGRPPFLASTNNHANPQGARIGVYREFVNQNLDAPPVAGIPQTPDPDYIAVSVCACRGGG